MGIFEFIGRNFAWIVLIGVALIPVIFRTKMWVRFLCVGMLLADALLLIVGPLSATIRIANLPSQENMKKQAVYGDAWRDGQKATQEAVDLIAKPHLQILFIGLALIALFPIKVKNKGQDSDI